MPTAGCGSSSATASTRPSTCPITVGSRVVSVTEARAPPSPLISFSEPGETRGSEKKEKEKEKEKEKPECKDKNLFCGYWAKIGECDSDSKFMKIFCKASCKRC